MSLEKIAVEIERWHSSSSTKTRGCHLWFPWSGLLVLLIQNGILLISKLYIYKSRKNKFLGSTCLLKEISKIKNIEKKNASVNEKQQQKKSSCV